MKTIFVMLALALPILLPGQPSGHLPNEALPKKTIALRTGISMKYLEMGNPAGPAIIFVHGYTDSGRSFWETMSMLENADGQFRLIAPDLRGHGASSMPDSSRCAYAPEVCFRPADFAVDIIALMDQLGIPKAHVVGHSMGSVVAQELALTYPDRVERLVLIGAFVNGRGSATIYDLMLVELFEKTWRPILEQRPGFQWPVGAWSLTVDDLGEAGRAFLTEIWVVEPVAADIAAFIKNGAPENGLPYANPNGLKQVLVDKTASSIEILGTAGGTNK